jgi:glycosyltransferase 2 family protein
MKKKNSNILSILFIVLVFLGLIYYMVTVDGIDNIIYLINNIDYSWVIIGLVLTVIYWLLEGLCFFEITKKIYVKQKFYSSFRLAVIGRLFNNITPMSAGDQPMQLLIMKKEGKSYSDGASILLTRFIVYQIVLVIYTTIVIIFKYSYFNELIDNFLYLAIIGFVINLIVVIFLIFLAINEKFVYNIFKFITKILNKLKIIKDMDMFNDKFKNVVNDFKQQFQLMKKEKMTIFKVALYTFIEITVLYSITYVVYKSFLHTSVDYITIISAQALLSLITVYMPTPGAGLAAEGAFFVMFSNFFASNTMSMAILFWRIYTFYLPIIVGGIFLIFEPKNELEEVNLNEENI